MQTQKKVFVGPKNNKVNLFRILKAEANFDHEILGQTTLMIKNIPVKTMQNELLSLIDQSFYGKYDYFYLPMDLKTHQNVGFAFINMSHALFIPDFYM